MTRDRDRVVIATRGSRLALAQAEAVAAELRQHWPGLAVELSTIRTQGDVDLDSPVTGIGKGAFVNEVRQALLDGAADLAVHSYKDLPTDPAPGLIVAAVPMRADPRDVMVSRYHRPFTYLPEGAKIGTGSQRRAAQILRRRGDVCVLPIRGNVDTRLAKLAAGEFDAIVLAAAGLDRLGRRDEISEYFDTDTMIPAPGQGALALEARASDADTARLVAPLHDESSAYAVLAERTCLDRLGGGCNTPIGIFAITDGETMFIHGIVATQDGTRAARLRWTGPWRQAEYVGETLSELLLAAGAGEILSGTPIPPTTRYALRRRRELEEDDWDEPYPSRED